MGHKWVAVESWACRKLLGIPVQSSFLSTSQSYQQDITEQVFFLRHFKFHHEDGVKFLADSSFVESGNLLYETMIMRLGRFEVQDETYKSDMVAVGTEPKSNG